MEVKWKCSVKWLQIKWRINERWFYEILYIVCVSEFASRNHPFLLAIVWCRSDKRIFMSYVWEYGGEKVFLYDRFGNTISPLEHEIDIMANVWK